MVTSTASCGTPDGVPFGFAIASREPVLLNPFFRGAGKDANKLKDWYAAEVASKQMRKQGFKISATQQERKVQVLCSK